MPFSRSLEPLTDILHNIELARSFVQDMSYEEFCSDRRTVYAVTRCLEIISEASRRLPDVVKKRHPNIPWTDIAGAGNIYRHDYEDVLEQIVWETVGHGLEPLRAAVETELRILDES